MEMMTENYCDQCDEVLHAIVDVTRMLWIL